MRVIRILSEAEYRSFKKGKTVYSKNGKSPDSDSNGDVCFAPIHPKAGLRYTKEIIDYLINGFISYGLIDKKVVCVFEINSKHLRRGSGRYPSSRTFFESMCIEERYASCYSKKTARLLGSMRLKETDDTYTVMEFLWRFI